jgi:hypothetical protein
MKMNCIILKQYNNNYGHLQKHKNQEIMRTGRIINTGARKLDGQIRSLTLRDQLQQVINLKGVNTINHS